MFSYLFSKTPLSFFMQSFWRDEAFSYLLAKKSIWQILVLTAQDFNPPLYYILLHIWMGIFGTSEIAIRSLSLFFFIGTVYFAFDILTEIYKIPWKRAAIYLTLFFFNPVLNYYAFEARMYSMITFFATFSFYALFTKRYKWYIFACVCGLYTHYFMIFILATQALYLLLTEKKTKKHVMFIAKLIGTSVLFLLPWIIFVLFNKSDFNKTFWIDKPLWKDLIFIPTVLYSGYEKVYGHYNFGVKDYTPFLKFFTFVLIFILGIGFKFALKNKHLEHRRRLLNATLWTFVPPVLIFIVSLVFQPLFLPRYMMFSTVGLLILLIYLIDQLPRLGKISMFLVLFICTMYYQKSNIVFKEKKNNAPMYAEIKKLLKPGDKVFTDDYDFHVAQYYLGEENVFIYGKTYDAIPSYIGKVLVPKEKIMNTLPYYPNRAFIIKHNEQYTIQTQF